MPFRGGWVSVSIPAGRVPGCARVAGGGGGGHLVPGSGSDRPGGPAGEGFGVVAGRAESLAVGRGGGAVVGGCGDVVGVPDRGVAPGGAAGLVAGDQEPAQLPVEPPAAAVHRHQRPVGRGRVEPPHPGLGGVGDQVPGQTGRDRPVADEWAAVWSSPSSARSVITTWTSTGPPVAASWPVSRATIRSAISCPRLRGSPCCLSRSASRVSAAYAATPWATGRNPVSSVIVSGAGRRLTRRSVVARRPRRRIEPGSSS